MATFNGVDLGLVLEMQSAPNPVAWQQNAYCGVNGLQLLYGGSRGWATQGHGIFAASTPADVGAAMATAQALLTAGTAGTLVDSKGGTWTGVVILDFRPVGPVNPAPGYGYCQAYTISMLHPTQA